MDEPTSIALGPRIAKKVQKDVNFLGSWKDCQNSYLFLQIIFLSECQSVAINHHNIVSSQKIINCDIYGKAFRYHDIEFYMNLNENNNRERFSINLVINLHAFQVVILNLLLN